MRRAAATVCSLVLAGVLLAGGTLAALPGESAAQKLTAGEQVWGTISRAVAMVRDAFRIVTGRDGERQPEISKPASSTKNTAKAASFVPHPKQAAPAADGKSVDRKLGAGEGNVKARDKTAASNRGGGVSRAQPGKEGARSAGIASQRAGGGNGPA